MNRHLGRITITLFFIKIYIPLTLYFLKGVVAGVYVRETMETAILTHNFSWPYYAVLSSGSYIFTFSASRPGANCRPLPHQALDSQSLWLTVSKPKTPNWRPTYARLPVSALGRVYLISQCPRILVVTHVFLLIYIGASCNHIVYTAGASSSVKVNMQ